MSKFTWQKQRDGLLKDLAASLAREDALRVDAERYRWLRELPHADSMNLRFMGSDLDMVIDAELSDAAAQEKP